MMAETSSRTRTQHCDADVQAKDADHGLGDFEASELKNAVTRQVQMCQSKFFGVLVLLCLLMDLVLGGSLERVSFMAGLVCFCFAFAAHVFGARLCGLVRAHPMQMGVGLQAVSMVCMLVVQIQLATSMKNELMQHRVFLTAHIVIWGWVHNYFYFPFWVHVCFVAPVFLCSWLIFHSIVGFLHTSVILYGVFSHCVFPLFLRRRLDNMRWKQFQTDGAIGFGAGGARGYTRYVAFDACKPVGCFMHMQRRWSVGVIHASF